MVGVYATYETPLTLICSSCHENMTPCPSVHGWVFALIRKRCMRIGLTKTQTILAAIVWYQVFVTILGGGTILRIVTEFYCE